ncbi:MAG: hypothetical protein OHK0039_18180 [Bacteroidia bacterium]
MTAVLPLRAGGFQLYYYSLRLMGMGHAGTGLALDAAAAYYNPGAMPFLPQRREVQFGTTFTRRATTFLAPFSTQTVETEPSYLTPIHFYTTWKGRPQTRRERLAFGLSVNNPYVASVQWPDTWQGRFISQDFLINTVFIQPTMSYRLTPRLGLGLGLMYGLGTISIRKAINISGVNGSASSAQLTGTGYGVGLNAGLYYQVKDHLALGLSYRSPLRIGIPEGIARFNVPESLAEAYPDLAFETHIPLPDVLNAGLSVRPEQRLLLTFDLNLNFWQRLDSLHIDLERTVPHMQYDPALQYRNTWNLRMGGEYLLTEHWTLRGGWYYDQSPVQAGYLSPALPDADRIGLCGGAGLRLWRSLSIDLAVSFEFTGERTGSLHAANFAGTYETNTLAAGLGIAYAW